jgi:hypothetical protein
MLRRSLYEAIGGFDTELRTAEDIDFYLRAASRFGIGLLDQPLTLYTFGHESLSTPKQAYADYLRVIEGFVAAEPTLDDAQRDAALFCAYCRCASGLGFMGDGAAAARFLLRAAGRTRTLADVRKLSLTSARLFYRAAMNSWLTAPW